MSAKLNSVLERGGTPNLIDYRLSLVVSPTFAPTFPHSPRAILSYDHFNTEKRHEQALTPVYVGLTKTIDSGLQSFTKTLSSEDQDASTMYFILVQSAFVFNRI
jgi:hypothetical protein